MSIVRVDVVERTGGYALRLRVGRREFESETTFTRRDRAKRAVHQIALDLKSLPVVEET